MRRISLFTALLTFSCTTELQTVSEPNDIIPRDAYICMHACVYDLRLYLIKFKIRISLDLWSFGSYCSDLFATKNQKIQKKKFKSTLKDLKFF